MTVETSSNGGKSWRTLTTVNTDRRGYFTRTVSDAAKREWRLTWTSPAGTVYHGSATRAYKP